MSMVRARAFYIRCKRFAARWDGPLALMGITATVIVWIYSNFASASQLNEAKAQIAEAKQEIASAKAEVTKYVDTRHGEVMTELLHQRKLQEQILLRVRH